jgi:succinyl-CoA synthetase alpha subunit
MHMEAVAVGVDKEVKEIVLTLKVNHTVAEAVEDAEVKAAVELVEAMVVAEAVLQSDTTPRKNMQVYHPNKSWN